jgi:hypothetical protein
MRSCQLARTVACDDIRHLRVPFLCSDDLWRFGTALAYLSAPTGGKCLAVLTDEGLEMAYELRDPLSRHKSFVHWQPRTQQKTSNMCGESSPCTDIMSTSAKEALLRPPDERRTAASIQPGPIRRAYAVRVQVQATYVSTKRLVRCANAWAQTHAL